MKNILSIGLIIISICIVGFSVYNNIAYSKYKKEIDYFKDELNNEKQLAQLNTKKFLNFIEMSIASSNCILDNISLTDEAGRILHINAILNKGPKIVLRYSEINCMSCVDSCLNYLRKYTNLIGVNNIIILASYNRHNDLISFKRINKLIPFAFYNTNFKALNLPIEDIGIPYFFIIDEKLNCNNIFPIDPEIPEYIDMYFKTIITKYYIIETK